MWRKVHERLEDEPAARALDKADRLEVFQVRLLTLTLTQAYGDSRLRTTEE